MDVVEDGGTQESAVNHFSTGDLTKQPQQQEQNSSSSGMQQLVGEGNPGDDSSANGELSVVEGGQNPVSRCTRAMRPLMDVVEDGWIQEPVEKERGTSNVDERPQQQHSRGDSIRHRSSERCSVSQSYQSTGQGPDDCSDHGDNNAECSSSIALEF